MFRSLLTALALLYACLFVHELAHAVASTALGSPISHFQLGIGPGFETSWHGTIFRVGMFPIAAYVTQTGDPSTVVRILTCVAGPLGSISLLVFHPAGPLWRWFGLPKYVRPVDTHAARLKKKYPLITKMPGIDLVFLVREWGFTKFSAIIGGINILPIPPLDGSKVFLALLPQTRVVTIGYTVISYTVLILALFGLPLWHIVQETRATRKDVS